jgi:hypothetical protein
MSQKPALKADEQNLNNCCAGAAKPMGYRKPKSHGGPVNIVVSLGRCS